MKNWFDVSGKVAYITGASSGLGVQFAKCLAEQGCKLAISARRVEKLEQTKKEIEEMAKENLQLLSQLKGRTDDDEL